MRLLHDVPHINPHYDDIQRIYKAAHDAYNGGDYDLYANIVNGAAIKYPNRMLTGNIKDSKMVKDMLSFYNRDFTNVPIEIIQSHYKSLHRIANYLFDFRDELDNKFVPKDGETPMDYFIKWAIKNNIKFTNKRKMGGAWHINMFVQHKGNFSPYTAKKLYQTYVKDGGTIYDYSIGYGGRMLGAGLCKNNYKYIGVDPNKDNVSGYDKQIQLIRNINKSFDIDYEISGSEIYHEKWCDVADFAFSSPPYFDLEKYSEDDTQAYVAWPVYTDFLENYWRPTVQNAYKYLKDDGIFALNIKNKQEHKYWDDFSAIVVQEGFVLKELLNVASTTTDVLKYDNGYGKRDLSEHIGLFTKGCDIKVAKHRKLF